MVITGIDKNNIAVTMDIVQTKYLVAVLRSAGEAVLKAAAKEVFAAGYDAGAPVDALAATKSFANVVGFYTDKLKPVTPATEGELDGTDTAGPAALVN